MTGLTIDHGGVIAVDPDTLREVARRLDAISELYAEAGAALSDAHRVIVDSPGFTDYVDTVALWAAGVRAGTMRAECQETASSTLLMADVYEYVELRAEAEMLAHSDPSTAQRLMLQADRLAADDDRVAAMAAELTAEWVAGRFEGLDGNPLLPSIYGQLFGTAAFVGAASGLGKVLPGETLGGRADAVQVTPVKTSSPGGAPTGLAGALGRMPAADGAQIAVEKYSFADGRTKYVVYLKGTQSIGWGGPQPFDMKSNAELYAGGRKSASYQATLDALDAAGAQPGDEVDVVAHSQSGMIAAHLSMEGEFDVRMQVTAGSPVEPTLDDDQTIVQLRHPDDVVNSLAGGGSPEGTGSPDSVVISNPGDPEDTLGDFVLDAHQLDSYIDTAEEADASGDVRIEALDEFWEGLDEAAVIERTEYHAERVDSPERTHRARG